LRRRGSCDNLCVSGERKESWDELGLISEESDEEQQTRPQPLFLLATNGERLLVDLHDLDKTYHDEEDKMKREASLDLPIADELEKGRRG
jgi:hypothetical protein